jgi:NADH-quinone oxidoreductase subunit L
MYHLYTHAFFKALIFLMAGIIIHYALNEQDLRRIKLSPNNFIYPLLLFSSLSLLSFPYTSGFYSKESIILSPLSRDIYIYILTILGAIFTSLYSFKLLYKLYIIRIPNKYIVYFSHFPLYIYIYLLPLLFGSIYIGYYSYSYYISTYQYLLYSNPYIIIIPGFSIILYILLYYLSEGYSYYISVIIYNIYIFYNNKSYIDYIINKIAYKLLFIPYSLYKNIDKGILEYLGPLGLYKLLLYNNIYILSTYSKLNILLSFFITLLITIIFI